MKDILLPPQIKKLLSQGATLAISISGGKDSQALLIALAHAYKVNKWRGNIFAIHSDLGRAEWSMSLDHVKAMCERAGIELIVCRREQGDLQDQIEQRAAKLEGTGKPFWPSSAARYCTSDQKRGPIDKVLRQFDCVISAEGMRAEESAARAEKDCVSERSQIVTKTRQAYTWLPLHNWTEQDVWEAIGTSKADLDARRKLYQEGKEEEALLGWPAHPAYVFGNQRLSCSLCVLASKGDLINGARHNPEYFQALVALEQSTGFSFRKNFRLSDLAQ